MAALRVAVIGGDGIGPEVIDQAIRVADVAGRRDGAELVWNRLPWNTTYYKQHGAMMPADGWDQLRQAQAEWDQKRQQEQGQRRHLVSQLQTPARFRNTDQ